MRTKQKSAMSYEGSQVLLLHCFEELSPIPRELIAVGYVVA